MIVQQFDVEEQPDKGRRKYDGGEGAFTNHGFGHGRLRRIVSESRLDQYPTTDRRGVSVSLHRRRACKPTAHGSHNDYGENGDEDAQQDHDAERHDGILQRQETETHYEQVLTETQYPVRKR